MSGPLPRIRTGSLCSDDGRGAKAVGSTVARHHRIAHWETRSVPAAIPGGIAQVNEQESENCDLVNFPLRNQRDSRFRTALPAAASAFDDVLPDGIFSHAALRVRKLRFGEFLVAKSARFAFSDCLQPRASGLITRQSMRQNTRLTITLIVGFSEFGCTKKMWLKGIPFSHASVPLKNRVYFARRRAAPSSSAFAITSSREDSLRWAVSTS